MAAKQKKSTQYEMIKTAMQELCAKGMVQIETPAPKKIKEALSRYKQEQAISGTLFFECHSSHFQNGVPFYCLNVTRIS